MKREEKKGLPFFGIQKLAPYLKPYRMLFFWMVTMGGIGSAMDAVIPLFQQHAIDHFIAEKTMDGIGGFLALYILVMLVQTATNYISAYGACKVELYIGRDLKREAFNHLQTLSFSYFNQNSVGYIHARVMSDTDRIASTLAWGLMEGVWYIAYLLFAVVMMFVLNWHLALCVMVIVPVLVVSGAYFQKKLVFFHRRVREQNSRITGAFNEGITGAKTTKTLVIEDKVEREFDGLTGEMKRMSVRAMHFRSVFMSTTAFAASVALAIVLWRGALAWSSDAADTAKGIYNFCQTIFNLPCSLITPITISIIPTVTAALTRGNADGARHTEESAVRTMGLISLPCAVGLAVLAEPIIRLLAGNYGPESVATATPILAYLGIAVVFNSTVLLFNAIMQAHGDVTTPVVNMLIGGIVKVVVNYILVAIPSLNIIGAAIGTIVCYVTITALDLIAMRRTVTTHPAVARNLIRPAAAAAIMGAATFFAEAVLRRVTNSNTIICLGALVIAVIVYAIFVLALQCITYEDCLLLPKGEKIAKILHIKHKT